MPSPHLPLVQRTLSSSCLFSFRFTAADFMCVISATNMYANSWSSVCDCDSATAGSCFFETSCLKYSAIGIIASCSTVSLRFPRLDVAAAAAVDAGSISEVGSENSSATLMNIEVLFQVARRNQVPSFQLVKEIVKVAGLRISVSAQESQWCWRLSR